MNENRKEQNQGFWSRVFHLYYDGFRSMTVGKTLWLIIGIKLFIFFVILKWLFFPDFLSSKCDSEQEKTEYVRHQLTNEARAKANEVRALPGKEEEDGSQLTNEARAKANEVRALPGNSDPSDPSDPSDKSD